jgi:phage tail-like protein
MKKSWSSIVFVCTLLLLALVANLTACATMDPKPQTVALMIKGGIPNIENPPGNPGRDADDNILGGKFKFELAGMEVPITSYSGGGVTFEVKETAVVNKTENAPLNLRNYVIGGVKWEHFIIERNYSKDKQDWIQWWEKIKNGNVEYKNFTLSYLDQKGNPTGINIQGFNAFPIRYNTINFDSRSGSLVLRETLELVVGHYEYEGGIVSNAVQSPQTGSKGNSNLKSNEPIRVSKFNLYIVNSNGQSTVDGSWKIISGGACQVEVVEGTSGNDPGHEYTPGKVYYEPITLTGPLSKERKAITDWINATAAGKVEPKHLVLVFLNNKDEEVRTYNLLESFPISFSSGNFTADSEANLASLKVQPTIIEIAD